MPPAPRIEPEDDAPLYPTGGALAYRLSSSDGNERAVDAEPPAARVRRDRDASVSQKSIAPLDDVSFDETFRVSPRGSNFEKTVARACRSLEAGRSVRLSLAPGIYRKRIVIGPSSSSARLLIEARQPGTVVISGSEIWRDWQVVDGLWRAHWPHRWGSGNAPETYGDSNLETSDLMRRREMVFVNRRLYRQVLASTDLEPGTFFVNEATETVLVRPLENIRPGDALIEVGIRSGLIELTGRRHVTLRGLCFEHDASFYFTPQRGALMLANCREVLVEGCSFQWNNTKGLQISGPESERVVLRRVVANHNGCLGILATRIRDLRLEDCETSFNNWRGAWADKYRGSPCGIKVMRSQGVTLRGHRAIRNLATGIWIDEENREVRIQDSVIYGNYRGLHLEAGGGPVLVERATVCANRQEPLATDFRWSFGSGIVLTHMPDVTLRNNFIADNDTAQIGVRDDREQRILTDAVTGEKRTWRTERLVLENNTIVVGGTRGHLLRFPDRAFDGGIFLRSFKASGNCYVISSGRPGFAVGVSSPALNFAEWQKLTAQDGGSRHEQP